MHRLPPRQREVLEILGEAHRRTGRMPTVRELAERLGVKAPGTITDHLRALEEKGFLVREPGKSRNIRLSSAPEKEEEKTKRLPVLGCIAAGRPLEAIEDPETFSFSEDLDLEGVFLLRVKGESMIEDCIADGDLVAIKPQSTARNGEIVVALLPDGEATLKRFYREEGRIRLQPANSSMEPIYVPEVVVQGRVVAVIRRVR